ncbi:MAG: hypothetical protein NT013_27590 [Planctomycetia bacterium]|nr:hypothetical protein [Planctomycetia bacterium]
MTETTHAKPSNFVRDQIIVLVILIAALFCRNSLATLKPTTSTEIAMPSHAGTTDVVADTG